MSGPASSLRSSTKPPDTRPHSATHIARRLERAPPVVAFPWQLVLASELGRLLPAWIYDRLVGLSVN
jgi:hypothetical protein